MSSNLGGGGLIVIICDNMYEMILCQVFKVNEDDYFNVSYKTTRFYLFAIFSR